MSLLNKKSDVQKHLSHHGRKHPHVAGPATGFSAEEVATPEPSTSEPILQSDAQSEWTVSPASVVETPGSAVPPKPRV